MAMREERAARRARAGTVRLQVEHARSRRARWCSRPRGSASRSTGRRSCATSRPASCAAIASGLIGPNGAGQDDAAAAAARRAGAGRGRGPARRRTCRSRTTTSSASSSTRSARCSTRSATATTWSPSAGRPRHVNGYLRDFLFPPERARSPVKTLSGGERNRLLLARLFTRPANVLVLDEPTNDLDIETLELLEAQLVECPGTLLLVSHDRVVPGQRRDQHAGVRGRRTRGGVRRRVRRLAAAKRAAAGGRAPRGGGGSGGSTAEPRKGARAGRPAGRRRCPTWNSASSTSCRRASKRSRPSRTRCSMRSPRPGSTRRRPTPSGPALARLEGLQLELVNAYARWDELDSRTSG